MATRHVKTEHPNRPAPLQKRFFSVVRRHRLSFAVLASWQIYRSFQDVIFLPLRFFPTFVETSTMLAFFWTARRGDTLVRRR